MNQELLKAEFSRLEDRDGRITPQAVVDAARHPDSPLHSYFEWDNKKASELYRQIQARQLIRRITVYVETEPVKIGVTRYIRDPEAEPDIARYRNIDRVAADPDLSRQAAVTEIAAAAAHLRRAREIALVLSYPTEDFDRTLESLATLRRRADELPAVGRPS